MKRILLVLLASAGLLVSAHPTFAQRGNGGSKPKPPAASKPTTTTMKTQGAPKVSAPKPAKGPSVGGSKKTMLTPGATAKSPKPTKSTPGSKPNAGKSTTDTTTASVKGSDKKSTTATSNVSGTTEVVLTPVQQKLQRNTNLADKLQRRLPPGTDLMAAAAGFTRLGQFVSAVNASNRLGIPFEGLKSKLLDDGLSLGQAIQVSKTTSNAYVEAQRAEYDAQRLIAESEPAPQPTPSTTTTKPKKRTPGGVR